VCPPGEMPAIVHPRAARSAAIAAPMPRLAPVTMTVPLGMVPLGIAPAGAVSPGNVASDVVASGIAEVRLTLFDERAHAFLGIFGLEGQRGQVRLDLQPLVQRHAQRPPHRLPRETQRRQAEADEAVGERDA